ncbi:MAG: enoyl-CoA hydratase/isomerase family protein [Pseudomonadota bacterium]
MSVIDLQITENISTVRLSNGVTNAISPQLLQELESALSTVVDESCGLVLAGGEKFFSIGFDLPTLVDMNRESFKQFWDQFNRVFFRIYTLPVPTISALEGHAVAGGAVLSLATDFRIGSRGKKQFGLNEIKLGIPIPYSTDLVLRQIAGDRVATQLAFSGEFVLQENAVALNLLDDVADPEETLSSAREKMNTLAKNCSPAFAAIKACRTQPIIREYETWVDDKDKDFLDIWFDPRVQEKLKKAAESF